MRGSEFYTLAGFIWILFCVLLFLFAGLYSEDSNAQGRSAPEASYVTEWCDRHGGRDEVVLEDRTRVDCETYYHVLEFDFADKWAEAIGQALHYALVTGKRGGIVLIVEDPGAMRYVARVQQIVGQYSLPLDVMTVEP